MRSTKCVRAWGSASLAVAIFLTGVVASAQCTHPAGPTDLGIVGDLDGNGKASVSDAICLLLTATAYLADPLAPGPACLNGDWRRADLDCSGAPEVGDAVLVVRLALSESLGVEVDADADGCADTCVDCTAAGGGSCLIAGCVPEGDASSGNPCQICQPAVNSTSYSTAPESWPCGGGMLCIGGSCVVVAPGPPAIQSVTAGREEVSVAFSPPASNGGAAVDSYTATCAFGGSSESASGTFSPIVVSGLMGGETYTCTVTATNSAGEGASSSGLQAVPTSCDDGVENGPEAGVDCGGDCASCVALGGDSSSPASSCFAISQAGAANGNGLYWIALNSGVTQLYCHFDVGGTGGGAGWTRVGALDGTQTYCSPGAGADLRVSPTASAGKIPDSDTQGLINNTSGSPADVMYFIRNNNRWMWHDLQNVSDFNTNSKHNSSNFYCGSWHCFGGGTDSSSCGSEGNGCPVTAHGNGGGHKKIYMDSTFSSHARGLHTNGSICGEPNFSRASAWVLVR